MGLLEAVTFPLVSESCQKKKREVLFVVLHEEKQLSQFNKVLKPVSHSEFTGNFLAMCFKYAAEHTAVKSSLQSDLHTLWVYIKLCDCFLFQIN